MRKTKSYLLFFSTDLELDALDISQYYKNRFQIEFLYRDGKQHTGLNDCQARSENKLHFHFNASLTAINLAKVEHWLSIPKKERGSFSMSDIKTMYHNKLLLERFIDVFAVPAYKLKNNNNVEELINFDKIADFVGTIEDSSRTQMRHRPDHPIGTDFRLGQHRARFDVHPITNRAIGVPSHIVLSQTINIYKGHEIPEVHIAIAVEISLSTRGDGPIGRFMGPSRFLYQVL